MGNRKIRFFGIGTLLTIITFAGAWFCFLAKAKSGFNAVLWLPNGVSFSALFLLGLEFWPFIILGEILSYAWVHASLISVICDPLAAIAINYYVAHFLRKKLAAHEPFSRLNSILTFIVVAVVIGPFLCSGITSFLFYLGGGTSSEAFLTTWRAWWLGEGMGTLVIGGLLVNAFNDQAHSLPLMAKRRLEAIILFFIVTASCAFIFTPLEVYNKSLLIKPYFLYTLMLYASLRFDLLGASMTALIMALTAMIGETLGFVAFTTSTINSYEKMLMLQLILGVISITGLVVAATVREKSEALDAKNEFLDIASHELKTPITSLKLQLQLLQRRLGKKSELSQADTEQKTFLDKVDRQVDRLVKIVEQLLDVSRVERKHMELDCEEVVLLDLVLPLVERLSGDFQNAKCTIQVDIPPHLKGVWDPFRLEQTLENLLSNAIKYAPGKSIELSAAQTGMMIDLKVRDQGPGIDPSKQHSIFDRFVRASDVRHVQGLGLGLFITRRIIEAHGGTISVKSNAKDGTTFTVCLPVDDQNLALMTARPQKA